MDIVDKINAESIGDEAKLIRLWAVGQLNYRQPLGDKALHSISELVGNDMCGAIMFISGFSMGMGMKDGDSIESLRNLVPELQEMEEK